MEFWSNLTEEKGLFLPEEVDMVKNRSKVLGQEPETLFGTTNCHFRGQELMDLGFSDLSGRQSDSSNPSRDVLSDQLGTEYYSEVVSEEKRLGPRMSSLFEGSDGVDLATVKLKLGESSKTPTKRTRLTSLYPQKPICQVQGCSKDLSSFKDYYKRHKVCDAHTKTARVIVKGIEQRFCQQCSRFHLLAEFDDGKRSCRKRLANHNERRRKPPGTRHLNSSARNSYLLGEMLHNSFPRSSETDSVNWFGLVKFEDPVASDQTFSYISDSSRALSLLSAQSRKVFEPFGGTAISSPFGATLGYQSQSSEQVLTHSSANSDDVGFSGFRSPDKAGPSSSVSSDGGINTGSNTLNGAMVNLLQLSSHLEMVEHKRKLMD